MNVHSTFSRRRRCHCRRRWRRRRRRRWRSSLCGRLGLGFGHGVIWNRGCCAGVEGWHVRRRELARGEHWPSPALGRGCCAPRLLGLGCVSWPAGRDTGSQYHTFLGAKQCAQQNSPIGAGGALACSAAAREGDSEVTKPFCNLTVSFPKTTSGAPCAPKGAPCFLEL